MRAPGRGGDTCNALPLQSPGEIGLTQKGTVHPPDFIAERAWHKALDAPQLQDRRRKQASSQPQ